MNNKYLLLALALATFMVLVILGRIALREPLTETLPSTETQSATTLGFIRAVTTNDGAFSIAFDDARWLTGAEGERAAIAAGRCTPADTSDCMPNGYFIENTDTATTPLLVSPDVQVMMETYETGEPGDKREDLDLATFTALINDPTLYWNRLPYHVTTENGVVTMIAEQYIP